MAALAAVLVLLGIVLALVETNWGKDQLRQLIVSQTARFLNGTLEIDSLDGSLLRGIRLRGVRLTEHGEPIIAIDDVSVAYSIRELYTDGTAIRRLTLGRSPCRRSKGCRRPMEPRLARPPQSRHARTSRANRDDGSRSSQSSSPTRRWSSSIR